VKNKINVSAPVNLLTAEEFMIHLGHAWHRGRADGGVDRPEYDPKREYADTRAWARVDSETRELAKALLHRMAADRKGRR